MYSSTNPPASTAKTFTWTAGQLTKITMVLSGVTYEKTLVWSGSELQSISVWVRV